MELFASRQGNPWEHSGECLLVPFEFPLRREIELKLWSLATRDRSRGSRDQPRDPQNRFWGSRYPGPIPGIAGPDPDSPSRPQGFRDWFRGPRDRPRGLVLTASLMRIFQNESFKREASRRLSWEPCRDPRRLLLGLIGRIAFVLAFVCVFLCV